MLCTPGRRLDVANVAIPEPLSVPEPMGFVPSRNCTWPVGAGPVMLRTVAVNVTDVPKLTFAFDVAIVTAVVPREITSGTSFDVPAALVESPAYFAVMSC